MFQSFHTNQNSQNVIAKTCSLVSIHKNSWLVLPKHVLFQASSRGIKNAYSVEQKKKKQEEMEKRMTAPGSGGGGGLRVSLKKKQHDATVCIFTEKVLLCCCPQDWITWRKAKRKGNESMGHFHTVFSVRLHFFDTKTARMAESSPPLPPQFLHCTFSAGDLLIVLACTRCLFSVPAVIVSLPSEFTENVWTK